MFHDVDFFHFAGNDSGSSPAPRGYRMEKPNPTMAQQIAKALAKVD
jgi:hypothetical protein